ncbi:hypothetical protein C8R45DRAFT_1224489 [Mycena sanguinolenta]|nr:hypothetical protein C8R45DRAFT_1224489 [Mycena sanguinolenta]
MVLLLSNLAPDVIFSIFAHCDISSAISASQTCRYHHDLAFDKSVWLALLDNLRRRSILDRTSNLETLSVAEVIGIVRQLITGPQTWSPGILDYDPVAEVSKTITLHPQGGPEDPAFASVKLLPSASYVLFQNRDIVECWDAARDRLVWRHKSCLEHNVVIRFAAEEMDIDSVIVMLCLWTRGPMYFIEIVSVDLRTGTSNLLLIARAPKSGAMFPFCQPVICGALAAVRLDSGYMIFDWREKSYFIMRGHNSDSQFALISRHIVVLNSSVDRESQIHLISNDTIGTFLSPTIGLNDTAEFSAVSVQEMPKLHSFHVLSSQPSFVVTGMQIHASPIREADYRVWIWGANHNLVSYQLSIPVNRRPHLRRRSQVVLDGMQTVSYSGHVLSYESSRRGWRIISVGPSVANPRIQLFHDPDLATYSGAVTSPTIDSTILIQYYK